MGQTPWPGHEAREGQCRPKDGPETGDADRPARFPGRPGHPRVPRVYAASGCPGSATTWPGPRSPPWSSKRPDRSVASARRFCDHLRPVAARWIAVGLGGRALPVPAGHGLLRRRPDAADGVVAIPGLPLPVIVRRCCSLRVVLPHRSTRPARPRCRRCSPATATSSASPCSARHRPAGPGDRLSGRRAMAATQPRLALAGQRGRLSACRRCWCASASACGSRRCPPTPDRPAARDGRTGSGWCSAPPACVRWCCWSSAVPCSRSCPKGSAPPGRLEVAGDTDRGLAQGWIMAAVPLGAILGALPSAVWFPRTTRRACSPLAVATPLALVPTLLEPPAAVVAVLAGLCGFAWARCSPWLTASSSSAAQGVPGARVRRGAGRPAPPPGRRGARHRTLGPRAAGLVVVGVWSILGLVLMLVLTLFWPPHDPPSRGRRRAGPRELAGTRPRMRNDPAAVRSRRGPRVVIVATAGGPHGPPLA